MKVKVKSFGNLFILGRFGWENERVKRAKSGFLDLENYQTEWIVSL